MRVAILSCGPSVGMYENLMLGPYDAVLAVNQAAELYPCDWWVFKDKWIFYQFKPKRVSTGICSLGNGIAEGFRETDPETGERLVYHEFDPDQVKWARTLAFRNIGDWEFNGFKGHGNSSPHIWKRFTISVAFMLAYQLGATKIHVYGADMEGEHDFAGRGGRRPTDRDEERWTLEQGTWETCVTWLGERGITVRRILL